MKKVFSIILCICLLLCCLLSGCASSNHLASNDLMNGVKAQKVNLENVALDGEHAVGPADFAVRLLKENADEDKNVLVSPISVLYALAMTANGANGNTLTQMETVLGMPVSDLNAYLKVYADALPEGEKYKLSIANSIWFTDKDSFTVLPEFLQTNANYYNAGIYETPFDESARKEINKWVEENTDGMIEDILDNISSDAVMYLVNALAFDAQWQDIYTDRQVRDALFTTENGEEQEIELMYSEESRYLEDADATGFLKYYADAKYAFVALLPNEGVTVQEYLNTLSGERLTELLANPQEGIVNAAIPKFESEYAIDLGEVLQTMGMTDAFDMDTADFSGLGAYTDGNIYISRVIHKTYIAVDERGTKAGAATAVEMEVGGAMPQDPKQVYLDRPFVYMIIDCEANLPLFIGTVMNMQ